MNLNAHVLFTYLADTMCACPWQCWYRSCHRSSQASRNRPRTLWKPFHRSCTAANKEDIIRYMFEHKVKPVLNNHTREAQEVAA